MSAARDRRQQLEIALIDAAERTIARDGLAALRARDLAAAAGCALGAIYNVFHDLDALIVAVNMRTLALLDRHLRDVAAATSADPPSQDPDVARLVCLARGYLAFATAHGPRLRALFEHRLEAGHVIPDWYRSEQNRIFLFVEDALRALRPGMTAQESALLARTLFSAVHGVVSLGLEQKLGEMPAARLQEQTAVIVEAIARGLRHPPSAGPTKASALERRL